MPDKFDDMKSIAQKLSKDIPFVRVDFYYINRKVYFGEMTFYPDSGCGKIEPKEWDNKLGEWIKIC